MIRSVIEGVSYSQRDGLDIIEGMGVPVESVRLSGGGARSLFWRQLMADILSKRVVTLDSQEGSAYGAALLAVTGTGVYGTVEECCRVAIHEAAEVRPHAARAEAYAKLHSVYQAIYPALKPVYGQL
jgi:xylulokinase